MVGEILGDQVQERQDIDDVFETNKPFADETVERSIGRLGWLAARIRAEFIATVSQLDMTDAQRSVVLEVLNEAIWDLTEFVEDGIIGEGKVDMQPSDFHPKQDALDKLSTQVEDKWDEADDKVSDQDVHLSFSAQDDLGGSDSEVLIEIMKRLADEDGEQPLAIEE